MSTYMGQTVRFTSRVHHSQLLAETVI